jgi:hypothetical protein
LLGLAVPAIAVLAGVTDSTVGFPQSNPRLPWFVWAETVLPRAFGYSILLTILLVLCVTLLMAVILVINPKNRSGVREPRKKVLTDALRQMRDRRSGLTSLLVVCLTIFAASVLPSLLLFMAVGKVGIGIGTPATGLLTEGWQRYRDCIIVIYMCIAVFMVLRFLLPLTPAPPPDEGPLVRTSARVVLFLSFALVLVVSVYAAGVYPGLPQHLGGGQLLRVQVMVSSDQLRLLLSDPAVETYLVDRTSSGSIILLLCRGQQRLRILEVAQEAIEAIVYTPSP